MQSLREHLEDSVKGLIGGHVRPRDAASARKSSSVHAGSLTGSRTMFSRVRSSTAASALLPKLSLRDASSLTCALPQFTRFLAIACTWQKRVSRAIVFTFVTNLYVRAVLVQSCSHMPLHEYNRFARGERASCTHEGRDHDRFSRSRTACSDRLRTPFYGGRRGASVHPWRVAGMPEIQVFSRARPAQSLGLILRAPGLGQSVREPSQWSRMLAGRRDHVPQMRQAITPVKAD